MRLYRIDLTIHFLSRIFLSRFWFFHYWHTFEEVYDLWRDDHYGLRLCGIGFQITLARGVPLAQIKGG